MILLEIDKIRIRVKVLDNFFDSIDV